MILPNLDPANYPKVKFTTGGRAEYLLAQTTAPPAYDGFGTVTLGLPAPAHRLVLIRPEHLEWQVKRYMSGLFGVGPACDPSPVPEDT